MDAGDRAAHLPVMTRLILLACLAALPAAAQPIRSERAVFTVTTVAGGLEHPWALAFLPDRRMLVTERPGRVRIVDAQGRVSAPLSGVPEAAAGGQGGMLDIALAPDFAASGGVFFCHSGRVQGGSVTRVSRARFTGDGFAETRPILDATPAWDNRMHFGCRLAFAPDGTLFVTTGERSDAAVRESAQKLDDLRGKVLRITRDGAPAPGNPFLGQPGRRGEIWSYGHRNPQALAFRPGTDELWEAEHGPRGGDELNLIRAGANYGWPRVGSGVHYNGAPMPEGRSAPGLVDPVHTWTPSLSPAGMAFYTGDAFPDWRGSLFLGSLNGQTLIRLTMDGQRVTGEERLLRNMARLRDVRQGPDGRLYLLTDERDGKLLRLDPA